MPEEALYEGNAVFVIVDGRAQKRSVSIAYKEPGYVYIQGNLRENEVAIISRLAGIGEGMKLETRKWIIWLKLIDVLQSCLVKVV